MLLAHKIELRPTATQAEYLNRACGSRRHCYNQLLAHFNQEGVKWSKQAAYQHYITVLRIEFRWYLEVSARVTRNAIDDLARGFDNFFRRVKTKQRVRGSKKNPYGYPQFKKKDVKDSFALREARKFDVVGRELRIEKLGTKIKMRQRLRFTGNTKQVTISKRAGKFFASILVDTEDYNPHTPDQESVGVDLGLKFLAALSDGTNVAPNHKLKDNLDELKRKQRRLSRKQKGSNRRAKAKQSVAKLHYRIANQRKAVLHDLTDMLTRKYKLITIEDLNVSGMIKNRKLSRSIADAGWAAFREMLIYKAELRGVKIVLADRFFASTKLCYQCHKKQPMVLGTEYMDCECGWFCERDLNASLNLNQYGLDTLQPDPKRTQELQKTRDSSRAAMLTV